MRKIFATLAIASLVGAAACEADRETFEETDATLAPSPEIEAARENPVNPTGEALDGVPADDTVPEGTGAAADTAR